MDSNFVLVILLGFKSMGYAQDDCKPWTSIPPEKYNKTFVQINSAAANEIRPLGFLVDTIRFPDPSPPCYIVSNTNGNGRHIEIKWNTNLDATICVDNNQQQQASPQCSSGKEWKFCSGVPGEQNSVTYKFSCMGSNCEAGDRKFWFRFLVEPEVNGTFDENWCNTGDSQFPSGLAQLPARLTPPTSTPTTSGAEIATVNAKVLALILCLLCYAFLK